MKIGALSLALVFGCVAGCHVSTHHRPLNNLVTELLEVAPVSASSGVYAFVNPRDGWVFFSSTSGAMDSAAATVTLDGADGPDPLIAHDAATNRTQEAMRHLEKGKHTLRTVCADGSSIERLCVRAIPEMISYSTLYTKSPLIGKGPHDAELLEAAIRRNVNTLIVGASSSLDASTVQTWTGQGKRWLGGCGIAWGSAAENYDYWTGHLEKAPFLDGLIADEFCPRARISNGKPRFFPEQYAACSEAIKAMHESPRFRGKQFYAYIGDWQRFIWEEAQESTDFAQTLMDSGNRLSWERYFREQPTEAEAHRYLDWNLKQPMQAWRAAQPDAAEHLIICMGLTTLPSHNLSNHPHVDYKVWMDMQVNVLANDPTYAGLAGFMWWGLGGAEEEMVRWTARLFRHYGIEGRTDRLSADPYLLRHIENPDFEQGARGWTIEPADDESTRVRTRIGYGGGVQGRVGVTEGNHFLWMKRSATKPNRFGQEIRHLEPGRLYSVKLLTVDYAELTGAASGDEPAPHALSVEVEGARVETGNRYHHVFPVRRGVRLNYWWRVFRAESTTARLIVSDWQSEDEPGGPIGQELVYNFVEVQPYLED